MSTEEKIISIVASICDQEINNVTLSSSIGDFPKWDSLGHITILSEVANFYNIELEPEDIMEIENVDDIVKIVCAKSK